MRHRAVLLLLGGGGASGGFNNVPDGAGRVLNLFVFFITFVL